MRLGIGCPLEQSNDICLVCRHQAEPRPNLFLGRTVKEVYLRVGYRSAKLVLERDGDLHNVVIREINATWKCLSMEDFAFPGIDWRTKAVNNGKTNR